MKMYYFLPLQRIETVRQAANIAFQRRQEGPEGMVEGPRAFSLETSYVLCWEWALHRGQPPLWWERRQCWFWFTSQTMLFLWHWMGQKSRRIHKIIRVLLDTHINGNDCAIYREWDEPGKIPQSTLGGQGQAQQCHLPSFYGDIHLPVLGVSILGPMFKLGKCIQSSLD